MFWASGIRHTRLTKQRRQLRKKSFSKYCGYPCHNNVFFQSTTLSTISRRFNPQVISIIKRRVGTNQKQDYTREDWQPPTWIYIDDKMYLIEKELPIGESK